MTPELEMHLLTQHREMVEAVRADEHLRELYDLIDSIWKRRYNEGREDGYEDGYSEGYKDGAMDERFDEHA